MAGIESILENQFAAGGLVILLFTSGLYLARSLVIRLWQALRRSLVYELTICNDRRNLEVVGTYIISQCKSFRSERLHIEYKYRAALDESLPAILLYIPWNAIKLLKYRSRYLLIKHHNSERQNQDVEYLSIYTFIWNKHTIYELCEEAKEYRLRTPQTHISVKYWNAVSKDWSERIQVSKRPITSVILHNNQQTHILSNLQHFYSPAQQSFYANHGIPYKQNVLLHGPPGSGKSSLIRAISSELNKDIHIIDMSCKDLTDADLSTSMASANGIVVLEDIDCLTSTQRDQESKNITFSGLLNALDGVVSADGTVIFMTTNHIDKLDPVLVRSGRVDVQYELGMPDENQIAQLVQSLLGHIDKDIVQHAIAHKYSMADIQKACMEKRS